MQRLNMKTGFNKLPKNAKFGARKSTTPGGRGNFEAELKLQAPVIICRKFAAIY